MTAGINKMECKPYSIGECDQCTQRWSFEKADITDDFLAILMKNIREEILKNNFGNESRQGSTNGHDTENVEMLGTT